MPRIPEGSITEQMHEILRIVGPHGKKGITRRDLLNEVLPKFKDRMAGTVSNAVTRKRLKSVGKDSVGNIRWALCDEWAELYKNLDTLKTVAAPGPKVKNKKPANHVKPAPEPKLTVDVSKEANSFADYAAALITQNAEYRATLLSVYNTIGKLLNQPTKEE